MSVIARCVTVRQLKIKCARNVCGGSIVSWSPQAEEDYAKKTLGIQTRFHSAHLRCTPSLRNNQTILMTKSRCKIKYDFEQRRCFSLQAWAMWVSQSTPVLTTQTFLQLAHDTLHLPWWLTIISTTIGLRFLITLPLSAYAQAIMARLQNLQPEIKTLAEALRQETFLAAKMYDWPQTYARRMFHLSLKKRSGELIVRENCHPFKTTIVAWVQIPMWISLSFAYRNLVYMMPTPDIAAQVVFLELVTGGALWFPNLTVPDASFILPVTFGIINLAITEIHALRTLKSTRFQTIITNVLRIMSVVMIPIAASVPSCLALYWTASSAAGLAQNILLLFPTVRRACRIPHTSSESNQPIQDLVSNLKIKTNNLKAKLRL